MDLETLPEQVRAQVEAADAFIAAHEPQNAPETSAPPAPAPPPAAQDAALWEQRYRSLQGSHNSHMADLKQRLEESERTRAETERRISKMEEEAAKAQQPSTKEDADTFGSDLVEMVGRVAKALVGVELAQLRARLDSLEQVHKGTQQTVTQTAEDSFLLRLERLVPDYREVNAKQAFLDWLAQKDPVYGIARQAALDSAARDRDAERTATIFNAFKALNAPAKGQGNISRGAGNVLERMVAPSAGAATPTSTHQEPQLVTQAFVQGFYRDVAQGKYRGREDDMNRIEGQINRALAENRIR